MNSSDKLRKRRTLRQYYLINFEIALIVALLIFLGIFNINLQSEQKMEINNEKQEVVQMEEVIQTKQQEKAPAPPRPQAPVEVPNDEVLEDESIDLDAELDMGQALEMPSEPPPSADEEDEESEIFVVVERMPKLKGGMAAVHQHMEYPEMARKAGIEGRVIVQFVVDENGNVNNPKVVRGIGGGCNEEALRVVKKLEFVPGMQRGRPVKVRYTMPIRFALEA